MADQSPSVAIVNVGVVNNAILPLWKVPTGYGGITILGVQDTGLTAGSWQGMLIDGGTAGTLTTGGTLANAGTAGTAHAAKTPVAWGVSAGTLAYLAEGRYLCFKEANVGSTVTVTEVAITFRFGK